MEVVVNGRTGSDESEAKFIDLPPFPRPGTARLSQPEWLEKRSF